MQQAALVVEASAQHLAEGGAIQRGSDQESTHSEAAQVAQPAPGTPETPATAEHERSQATIFPEPSQAFLEAAHIVRGFKVRHALFGGKAAHVLRGSWQGGAE